MAYKLQLTDGNYTIGKGNMSIPRVADNMEYRQFIEDIALENDTVVGPDVISEGFANLRKEAYPSTEDQLDMQYWDGINSTTIWADRMAEIKALYPKSMAESTAIGDVPSWVTTEAAAWLATKQLAEYTVAILRLDDYIVSVGRAEVTSTRVIGEERIVDSDGNDTLSEDGTFAMRDITETYVSVSAVEAVSATVTQGTVNADGEEVSEVVENPLITVDVAERAAAQAIVDATPASVVDAYNAL